jgi:iron complex outermembrane receptor protein
MGVYQDGVINQMSSAERSVIGEVSGVYDGFDHHAVTLGVGFRWQDIYRVDHRVNSGTDGDGNPLPPGGPPVNLANTPYAFAPEKARTNHYLYVQDVWSIADNWEITAGARYDHDSAFGDALNPRIALVWQTNDKLTTKLMYGQAFRAPYFQELYTETSFSLPNPSLDPERSQTWELAFSFAPRKDLRLGINLYHFDQRDVIALESVPGLSKARYQNVGKQTIRGMEIEGLWQPTQDVRISANYAYNDPDGSRFREFGAPRHQAYLRADWRFLPDWNWNIEGNWIGERERSPGDPRASLDDYLVTDSTLRFMGVRDWEFALSVRNLFDADARDYTRATIVNDLPQPGRSLYLEARYDLDRILK